MPVAPQGDRRMPLLLVTLQKQDLLKAADMQRIGGRIKPAIERDRFLQPLLQSFQVGNILD